MILSVDFSVVMMHCKRDDVVHSPLAVHSGDDGDVYAGVITRHYVGVVEMMCTKED